MTKTKETNATIIPQISNWQVTSNQEIPNFLAVGNFLHELSLIANLTNT